MFDPDLLLQRLTQVRVGDHVSYEDVQAMCDSLARHIAGVEGAMIEKRIALFIFEMTNVIRNRRDHDLDKTYIVRVEAIWLAFVLAATEDFWGS